jgi:hypothetical protein
MSTKNNFSYNAILCYLACARRALWSAVRKFFYTNKRSRPAGDEEKRNYLYSGKTPEATTQGFEYARQEYLKYRRTLLAKQ